METLDLSRLNPKLEIDRLEYLMSLQTQRIEEQRAKIEELRTEIQRLVALASGSTPSADGKGNALQVLVEVMQDTTLTLRRRLRACEGIISYKTPPAITELAKQFLVGVFSDSDVPTDHKLDATELMRRLEAPKVSPQIIRLVPRPHDDGLTPEERRKQLAIEMEKRRRYIERKSREIEAGMGLPSPAGNE
jgi:hypothetical protein